MWTFEEYGLWSLNKMLSEKRKYCLQMLLRNKKNVSNHKRLGIIFHYRDEVYKGAIWVNCGQKNQQWKTLRKNGQQIVVTFQSGFIIDRLQEMHAGIASTLHKLNWGSINVFLLPATKKEFPSLSLPLLSEVCVLWAFFPGHLSFLTIAPKESCT